MQMMRFLVAATMALAAGCAVDAPTEDPSGPSPPVADADPVRIRSRAFGEGEPIPVEHTCDGEDRSPPLGIANPPADARTLALTVIDPDVPVPASPAREFTHWLVWNVPANATSFAEGEPPEGAVEGTNDADGVGWIGPCPPPLSPAHRYVFTAYAVESELTLERGATRGELEAALDGRVVDTAKLTGVYARQTPG